MTTEEEIKFHERWSPRGWPWQVELFTIFLILSAILLPICLPEHRQAIASALPFQTSTSQMTFDVWNQGSGYIWIVIILGAYFLHWVTAYLSPHFVSTPFAYMISPTIFGAIAYGRLFMWSQRFPDSLQVVRGSFLEALLWLLIINLITLLLARLRMQHHLKKFRDVHWDITLKPKREWRAIAQLLLKIHPLYYWPVSYKACGEGILIQGAAYIMPIPFPSIEAIAPAPRGTTITSAFFAATSMTSLLRVQLYDRLEAIFIAPKHPNLFHQYCEQILAGRLPIEERVIMTPSGPRIPYGEPDSENDEENPYYNV